jgi:hypothetical protein
LGSDGCAKRTRGCILVRAECPYVQLQAAACVTESPSLVLVINDTKLLMPCVKCFELGISNTCDEGVCGKE